MRTSHTHPLRIDALNCGKGQVGITFCPGKKGASIFGAPWDRSLDVDIAAIQEWGADIVVTLVEDFEFEMLGVPDFPEKMRHAFDWVHLPIVDLGVPNAEFERRWDDIAERMQAVLAAQGKILFHCRGGRGRAGMAAAKLLVETGFSSAQAIALVRATREGAIETVRQQAYLTNLNKTDLNIRQKHITASLIAGALGDSLGAAIEFWSLQRILESYPSRFAEMPFYAGRHGSITDDTQMTMFTAEGLLDAHNAGEETDKIKAVHAALLRWYITQGRQPKIQIANQGLVADPRLHHLRAPGNTCLSALGAAQCLGQAAHNTSKGCGTIMRVAPVAFTRHAEIETLALKTSGLTHGHPTGQEAAAAWALMLRSVFDGAPIEEAAKLQIGRFGNETDGAIRAALAAPRNGEPLTVETVGAGWIAEEALSIALYACLSAKDLEHGLRIAVTHSGDSDSTGAIAGNMLGLMFPDQVFSHRWADQIECRDLIEMLASGLAEV